MEIVPAFGRSGPFRHGDFVVVCVAVDGRLMPSVQIDARVWEEESHTLSEPEFWQHVADSALSMSEVEAML